MLGYVRVLATATDELAEAKRLVENAERAIIVFRRQLEELEKLTKYSKRPDSTNSRPALDRGERELAEAKRILNTSENNIACLDYRACHAAWQSAGECGGLISKTSIAINAQLPILKAEVARHKFIKRYKIVQAIVIIGIVIIVLVLVIRSRP